MGTKEIDLPEEMIHLIQSYLIGKEAARTSILSKSWYFSWLTRPDLHFDQRDFGEQRLNGRDAEDAFWQFVRKTMQRYDELKLLIQSLRLCDLYPKDNCSRTKQLIVRAIELGATDINFEVEDSFMFGFKIVLPKEVLGSETLRRLSVRGCKIGLGEAKCSRLESLSLKKVVFTDGNVIWDIISSCPLIENLSLSECKFLFVDTIQNMAELRTLRPFEKLSGSAVDGLISPFNKLKRLFLEQATIDTLFFHDFGSKFPCLKDLSVHHCDGYGSIRIASSSLESISFARNTKLKAKFDVPCIRKFMYQGKPLPSLSFKNYSTGWKSDISFFVHGYCAMFPYLKKLLANLGKDEICLSLKIRKFTDKTIDKGRDNCFAPVAVKDLMLYLEVPSSISSSFLRGLFWSCRPKFMTLHFFPCGESRNHDFLLLLSKTMQDLKLRVVNVEVFHEGPAEWRRAQVRAPMRAPVRAPVIRAPVRAPVRAPPFLSLLNASVSPKFRGKIRLQLI